MVQYWALKDCSSTSQYVLHIGFSDIKAQLVKSGLWQPTTNLVWQICFKIYPTTSEAPQNRWQIAEQRAAFCFSLYWIWGKKKKEKKITRAIQYVLFPLFPISLSGLMLAPWAFEWNLDSQFDLNMKYVFCLSLTESHVLIFMWRERPIFSAVFWNW